MDDLHRFTDFIFGDQVGFVYAPVKRPDEWDEQFYKWPEQRDELHAWIETNSVEHGANVYLSPAVYNEKSATKTALKSAQVVWVEFDGQDEIDFKNIPRPDCIVQSSSSTHLHCYWRIDRSGVDALEEINTRLTYHLEADSSGVDSTQLLRPPDSVNWKYEAPVQVLLAHFEPPATVHDFKEFDSAPKVKIHTATIEEIDLLDARKLLLTKPLPADLTRRIKNETPDPPTDGKPGQRSQFLYKIAAELAENGLTREETVTLLYYVDDRIGKFKDRRDRMYRLCQMADMASLKVEAAERLTLYTYGEVNDHVDHLDWIIPTWLHTTGQMAISAASGVGKTQFAMQMGVSLIAQVPFVGMTFPSKKEHRILMFSLEMDVRELRYITNHHSKNEWPEWDKTQFIISDELGSHLQYEAVIREVQPTVVMFDSLTELFEEDMTSSSEARTLMRWLRKTRRDMHFASVLIHHDRKEQGSGGRKQKGLSNLFGSFVFGKDTDTVLNLSDSGHKSIGMELELHKCRFGPKIGFKLERDDNLIFSRRKEFSVQVEERNPLVATGNDATGDRKSPKKNLGLA
jgi:hypothetical protein